MDDLQERMEIMEEGLLRCRQVLEDGWEDENYRYIESSITRILYDLQEKIGLPAAGEMEKVMLPAGKLGGVRAITVEAVEKN